MSKIVLQPSANAASQENYARTVVAGFPVADLSWLSLGQVSTANSVSRDGRVRLWGAKPGEDGRNQARWDQISPGDYLLFSHGGDSFTAASILGKFQNADQARSVWGTTKTKNGQEQTWELMMLLDEPFEVALTKPELNGLIGRQSNANVQEFVVLSTDISAPVIDAVGLKQSTATTEPVHDAMTGAAETPVANFDELDKLRTAVHRAEQSFLRQLVLPGATVMCALCERVVPREFLVAGHIKPRSKSTNAEKVDFEHVAMPNCKLGCDELWGRGYIGVDGQGALIWSEHAPDAGPVRDYMSSWLAVGRAVRLWHEKPGTRKYFEAHLSTEFKG